MKSSTDKRAENDKRVQDDIRSYGCHIISVFDPEEKEPSFAYSIGIQETSGVPEVIVCGLRPSMAGFVVNEYNRQVRDGKRFERGARYSGFLEGFSVYVEPARKNRIAQYTLGCDRYYGDKPFEVVQIVYPSVKGIWPWNKTASEWLKLNQLMLGRAHPNRA